MMYKYFGSSKKALSRRENPWDLSKQSRPKPIDKCVIADPKALGPILREWCDGKIDRVNSNVTIGDPFCVHSINGCANVLWCRELAKEASEHRAKKKRTSVMDHDEYQGTNLKDIANGAYFKGANDIVEVLEQSWAWNRPGCADVDVSLIHAFVVSYKPNESHMVHSDGTDLTINISLSEPGHDYDEGGLFFTSKREYDNNRSTWERYMIRHDIGNAILQDAKILHGASPIGRGERHNLILWCKVVSRFSAWKRLYPHLRTRVFSYLSLQGIARCDTAGAGVNDNVWKIMMYRLVGVKQKKKDPFHGRKSDELPLMPPKLSTILSDNAPDGEAYLEGHLPPDTSCDTWRRFFFKTLDKMSSRLDIFDNEIRPMAYMDMCVKMIMPQEPVFFDDDDFEPLKLEKTVSEKHRADVNSAAARCRKILTLTGDISLCPLFRGTRANVHEALGQYRDIQVDASVVEIRQPFAFESFPSTKKKRIHPGARYHHHKRYGGRNMYRTIRAPIYWLVTTPRKNKQCDVKGMWISLINNSTPKEADRIYERFVCVSSRYFDNNGSRVKAENIEIDSDVSVSHETYNHDDIPEPRSKPNKNKPKPIAFFKKKKPLKTQPPPS